ncbi:hypothetical protein PILCRDRAFT_504301 [Piloderma croceum F 1598]|uniref:Uncharacterized protein n=1 Tax=Piloderma croceum (strain F 1598) TaxID=765440 RepID=A0A0C3FN98_PILCF|nr:hypothetical protein PILCRDRAFT_504301 [Piloderma croceum F 1598]
MTSIVVVHSNLRTRAVPAENSDYSKSTIFGLQHADVCDQVAIRREELQRIFSYGERLTPDNSTASHMSSSLSKSH